MLLTWFCSAKTARPPQEQPPIDIQQALKQIGNLPSLSETATRAVALTNDPQATMGDYANLIKRDGGLAAAVLKLANSSLYRGSSPVTELHQAVLRLGLRTCSQLITSLGMRGLFRGAKPKTLERCEILWRHGFFTACLATQVNQFLSMGFGGEEFTAGLLHDLGRTFIALAGPEVAERVDPLDFSEDDGRLNQERKILGTDHAELGALYCERQGLPPALIDCNRFHHDPGSAMTRQREHRHLVALVALVDQIANEAQRTHQIRDYSLAQNPGYRALELGWQGKRLDALAANLASLVVISLRTTRTLLKCQLM